METQYVLMRHVLISSELESGKILVNFLYKPPNKWIRQFRLHLLASLQLERDQHGFAK